MEEWRDIPEYEGIYQISNLGRIKRKNKILKFWNKQGKKKHYNPKNDYQKTRLSKNGKIKTYTVHRLVAKTFIPNPENKPQVNHIDGNPLNNCVENLEWCTDKENKIHAIENNLKIYTINTIDRDVMLDLLNSGKTYDEIAEMLGIAKGTVFNYIRKFKIKKIYI